MSTNWYVLREEEKMQHKSTIDENNKEVDSK